MYAHLTPSALQNMQWAAGTPFGIDPPTQQPYMTPTNLFFPTPQHPSTIFEHQPVNSQLPLYPFNAEQFGVPHTQPHNYSSGGESSSTHTMPPPTQPSGSQEAGPDISEPAASNVVWMTEEDMLKISSKPRSSKVWMHFILSTDKLWAKCRYCSKVLTAASKSGTGHLARHTNKCPARAEQGQSTLDRFVTRPDAQEMYKYDAEYCQKELAQMIISNETPFAYVEKKRFNRYMRANQPEHKEVGRKGIRSNSMRQYCERKYQLIAELNNNTCKVSVTADAWDSGYDYHYVCVTAHWLDDDFVVQKRIIEFAKLEYPHNAPNLHFIMMNCLNEYGLRDKVLSLTFDNATTMTAVANMLKTSLENVLLEGELLHNRCGCHILNLCVRDGLDGMKQYHAKFKHVVLHLSTSKKQRQKWRDFCREYKCSYKNFPLENNTR
jgi:hypothetical protein